MSKVIIKKARLSYAHLFEPASINGSDPKYSVSLLIDKKDTATVDAVKAGIKDAIEEGKDTLKGKTKGIKIPLRDGDEDRPDDPAYAGMYFINANSNRAPQVLDQAKRLLDAADGDEIVYSGCYAHVTVNFYAFNASGNTGIAAGLGNVMKYKDGERFTSGSSAEEDFADIAEEVEEDSVLDDILG